MIRAALATVLLALPAAAQTVPPVDCARDDLAGPEFRYCAGVALDMADDDLNEAYRLAITRAKAFDADAKAEGLSRPVPLEEALRAAQRAWIAFRDSDCDAVAITFGGGTGGPTAGTLCRTERTLARIRQLQHLLADF